MKRMTVSSLVLGMVVLISAGCATSPYPRTLSTDTASRLKKIAIVDEISTPSLLDVAAAGGGVIGAVVVIQKQKEFTAQVSRNTDFQQVIKETLRESFANAIKAHPGWILVDSNTNQKADAAFVLSVPRMGVDNPPPSFSMSMNMKIEYSPSITISAMLIENPPFEVVQVDNKTQVLDPMNHPVLYQRTERVSGRDKLPCHSSNQYAYNPVVFKSAVKDAVDLAVKRIAESWVPTEKTK